MSAPRIKRCLGILATVALAACGPNWQPLTLPQPKPLGERTVVEFRVRDSTLRLHAVVMSKDSLSGIPWLQPTSCDTCRVRYATADLSNLRTGSPGDTAANLFILPLLGLIGIGLWIFKGIPSFSAN